MSESVGTYEGWLESHGLTEAQLLEWDVAIWPRCLLVPVYSLTGQRVFRLKRNFYGEQKYNVEPEGAKRGFQLYGLWRSLKFINAHRIAVCVEGFSDFLAIWPEVTVACGVLGSRLTKVQREMLKCFTELVIVWSDGDETGETVARNAQRDADCPTFGFIIDGLDPAAYVKSGGSADAAVAEALKWSKRYSFVKFDAHLGVLERLER